MSSARRRFSSSRRALSRFSPSMSARNVCSAATSREFCSVARSSRAFNSEISPFTDAISVALRASSCAACSSPCRRAADKSRSASRSARSNSRTAPECCVFNSATCSRNSRISSSSPTRRDRSRYPSWAIRTISVHNPGLRTRRFGAAQNGRNGAIVTSAVNRSAASRNAFADRRATSSGDVTGSRSAATSASCPPSGSTTQPASYSRTSGASTP